LPPSFLSSSPASEKACGKGGVKEASNRVGAARKAKPEDTALLRLDSARERATVADKVMRSGKMVNRRWPVLTCQRHASVSAQARIRESGRRRQG